MSTAINDQVHGLEIALPYNLEAERMILGVILLDNGVAPQAVGELSPADFFSPNNGIIFSVMRQMHGANRGIDPLTLGAALRKAGKLEQVGGPAYLASLFDGVPRFSNIGEYVTHVKEAALLRRAIKLGNWMINAASDPEVDIDAFLGQVQQKAEELVASRAVDDLVSSEQAIDRTLTLLNEQWDSGHDLLGMPTGIHALDHRLQGIRAGKYITIAANPGMGKTTLALNLANSFALAAQPDDQPVGLIITLEMSVEELKTKWISTRTGISTTRIETGHLGDDERRRVRQTAGELACLPVEYVEGFAEITASGILARVAKAKRKHHGRLDYLILDYIQLVDGEGGDKENENAKLTEISRTLKRIAIRYHIPVIVLSQLNRAAAARSNKDPELSDIRGSGSIVQDSDVVLFIAPNDHSDPENALRKLLVRKFRGGQTGVDLALFSGTRSTFLNIEDQPAARPDYQDYLTGANPADFRDDNNPDGD